MAEPAAAPAETPKKSGMTVILLVLNALLLAGVLAAVVMLLLQKPRGAGSGSAEGEPAGHGEAAAGHGGGHGGGGERSATPPGAGPTLRLADFVVHLRNPESDRYARFSFELEVGTEKDKEALTARQAQIRDAFIAYLSDRTVEDLRGSGGLEKLKAALLEKIGELAKDGHVRQLYITDFVLQ